MPVPFKSIQVQTTAQSADDIRIVDPSSPAVTHWSIYLRREDGLCEHVTDFAIGSAPGMAKQSALIKAAKLSMEHGIFIEKIL